MKALGNMLVKYLQRISITSTDIYARRWERLEGDNAQTTDLAQLRECYQVIAEDAMP